MTHPPTTLSDLRRAGLTARPGPGGALLVSPVCLLTPERRQAIADYKALLLDELAIEEAEEDAWQVKESDRLFEGIR
jgi:hypothetical protein